jgi:secondary thiamine-phosphate synthase enzyme
MVELGVHSTGHTQFLGITREVQGAAAANGWKDGVLTVFVPHTTAAVTIQENADPDVIWDMAHALAKAVPWKDAEYRHGEGNTAAHVKAAMLGASAQVLVQGGRLCLGTWQGLFFCEFDGPRHRKVWLAFTPSA